jgi:Arc/MetJ family transcription regulator
VPRQPTKSTKQLAAEIDAGLRDEVAERARVEGRKLRAVVERALRLYLRTPMDDLGPNEKPTRRRP